jgi:UDP-N-acetylmuramoylalanine--D-glutamate ligase
MSKPYAIFGAGLSAQAARRLALAQGHSVILFDEAGRGDCDSFVASDLVDFEAFVFSPGFAAQHPWRVLAESSGLPCMGELGFAARFWKGSIVAVTGTNGKSTLTALIHDALRLAGHVSVATGNIGYPFADAVLSDANQVGAYAVIEVSSFQAELIEGLELDALLWSNLAEDHLDRYSSVLQYFEAKARLFDCLKPDGICVIGEQLAEWMYAHDRVFAACTVAYEDVTVDFCLESTSVFNHFPHSENFTLVAEFWWLLGQPSNALVAAANQFSLAPHRLAVVAERGGVCFWDDSKATNFHATLAALESLADSGVPIVWIGGGQAKGGDVEAFAQSVAARVTAAVVYGAMGARLGQALAPFLETVQVHDRFEAAVEAAAVLAESLVTGASSVESASAGTLARAQVLLSPGFSSFDQFDSYQARGKSYLDTVLSLKLSSDLS